MLSIPINMCQLYIIDLCFFYHKLSTVMIWINEGTKCTDKIGLFVPFLCAFRSFSVT